MVNVTMGDIPQCVPINIRLISDEEGDMVAPDSPSLDEFPFEHKHLRRNAEHPLSKRTIDVHGRSGEHAVPIPDRRHIEHLFRGFDNNQRRPRRRDPAAVGIIELFFVIPKAIFVILSNAKNPACHNSYFKQDPFCI